MRVWKGAQVTLGENSRRNSFDVGAVVVAIVVICEGEEIKYRCFVFMEGWGEGLKFCEFSWGLLFLLFVLFLFSMSFFGGGGGRGVLLFVSLLLLFLLLLFVLVLLLFWGVCNNADIKTSKTINYI